MTLIEQIRRQYPNPVALSKELIQSCGYCVGGAIVRRAVHDKQLSPEFGVNFPSEKVLACALTNYNPDLTASRAREWAAHIIDANDDGRFEDAWRYAADALTSYSKEYPV